MVQHHPEAAVAEPHSVEGEVVKRIDQVREEQASLAEPVQRRSTAGSIVHIYTSRQSFQLPTYFLM